jgi:hypothetical protein
MTLLIIYIVGALITVAAMAYVDHKLPSFEFEPYIVAFCYVLFPLIWPVLWVLWVLRFIQVWRALP